jgi:hypothetical protein
MLKTKAKPLNELSTEQISILVARQREIEDLATDGDFNNWEFENATRLGISYSDYWYQQLWEFLGLVDFEIDEVELTAQKQLYNEGKHPLQELLGGLNK